MSTIILQYQVPRREIGRRTTYEVRTLQHTINPAKPFRDNLDDAFAIACDRGADPNKNIRWRMARCPSEAACVGTSDTI